MLPTVCAADGLDGPAEETHPGALGAADGESRGLVVSARSRAALNSDELKFYVRDLCSNFVDWSKITVPTAEPSEAVSFCYIHISFAV